MPEARRLKVSFGEIPDAVELSPSHKSDVKQSYARASYRELGFDSDGRRMSPRKSTEKDILAACEDEDDRAKAEVAFHHMCHNSEDINLPPRGIFKSEGPTVRSIAVTRHWCQFYMPHLVSAPTQGFYWQ